MESSVAIRIAQAMEEYEIMWQEDLMPLQNPKGTKRITGFDKNSCMYL